MTEIYLKTKKFFIIILIFLFLEILSFLTWYYPLINNFIFILIVLTTLIITWKNLNYGLLIASGELMVGSFGYLFNIELFSQTISWRMFIWAIIMLVWLKDFVLNYKKTIFIYKQNKKILYVFFILLLFLLLSILNGLLKNEKLDIVLDTNGWFYLFLLFPWLLFDKKYLNDLWNLMLSALAWLFFKTSIILYLFSHNFTTLNNYIYDWTRDFRLGEITFAGGNFWRIFMQSHIFSLFILIVLIYLLWIIYKDNLSKIQILPISIFMVFSLGVVLMSYSRSFWLALVLILVSLFIYFLFKKTGKKTITVILNFVIVFLLALSLIFIIVKFPWPQVDSSQTDLFVSRLKNPASEAAGNSRLNQFVPLLLAIKQSPFFGSGFGTKVTYKSTDPRIMSLGEEYAANYSTYAFELGYLDIWLKIGLFGLLVYFLFIYLVIERTILTAKPLAIAFTFGFMTILITNLTTPYLNHPLGIGIIFWLLAISNKNETA